LDSGGSFSVFPQTAILPPGTSTYAFIQNINPNLRYTLDGTEPTADSPVCTQKIEITRPCTLTVKSLGGNYKSSPSVKRIFAAGEYLNGLKITGKLKQGLKYSYYEGVWDSVPDLSKLTAKKTGITASLNLDFAVKKDSFAVRFEGYIQITKKDLYDLWVSSDDGAKVYLNDQLLLNNDGLHSADIAMASLIPLNPGYYQVRIDYFEKNGGESITLGYLKTGEKIEPVTIGKEMLFYK
jgi:hypothetical protein